MEYSSIIVFDPVKIARNPVSRGAGNSFKQSVRFVFQVKILHRRNLINTNFLCSIQ